MTIYLDMDGTFVDFYSVPNWLQHLLRESIYPYCAALPLCDMDAMQEKLMRLQVLGVKIGIVSWCSKNANREYNAAVRKAKKEWLKKYLPQIKFDEIHIIQYGRPKDRVVKDNGILIDDEEKNRLRWEKVRGEAFDPTTTNINRILDKIISSLSQY